MSTHNLCFRAKIRKNVYPCTPQFHYIKVGCKGVFVTQTCFRDDIDFLFYDFSVTWEMLSDVRAVHSWVCQLLNRGRRSAYQTDR